MKIVKILVVLFFTITSTAQNVSLRKLILKSDLIFESSDFSRSEIPLNDYTKQSFIDVHKIDKQLKESNYIIPETIKLKEFADNEDYFSGLGINLDYLEIVEEIEIDEEYYTIFFVIKNDETYTSLLVLEDLPWETYRVYLAQIKSMHPIRAINDDKERFSMTLDWFIENGLVPDDDFINYYKQKDIIDDTIIYTEEQYAIALKKFKNGNNHLLPIVKDRYTEEVKAFYLDLMQKTIDNYKPDYGDYLDFKRAVTYLTNDFNDESYFSGKNVINNSLTSDDFEDYEKKGIMEYLLELVKEWE